MNNNGQSAANTLTNQQVQVILTGKFGDGTLRTNAYAKYTNSTNYNYYYATNGIKLEYIAYKYDILENLCKAGLHVCENNGYKSSYIYKFATVSHPMITTIACESLYDSLQRMDEFGLALWFYDDGSLHQRKHFYNLNTQAFDKETNCEIIVPFLKNRFGIIATPTIERKKDGKEYWYLRIKKYDGAFTISEILQKYQISCFDYKRISSETILKWSKLQEKLKSADIDIKSLHPKTITAMLDRMSI